MHDNISLNHQSKTRKSRNMSKRWRLLAIFKHENTSLKISAREYQNSDTTRLFCEHQAQDNL